jgi:hypothetical protein
MRGCPVVIALVLSVAPAVLLTGQGPANEFKPDTVFTGSSLTGWQPVGAADWRAQDGEIIGRPRAGAQGGWLVLDKSFQDVNFFTRFRCNGPCKAGVLFRMQKTATGMTGVYVSLDDNDLKTYRLTLDAEGREVSRAALRPAAPFIRVAPPAPAEGTAPARGGGFSMVGAGRGGAPVKLPTHPESVVRLHTGCDGRARRVRTDCPVRGRRSRSAVQRCGAEGSLRA